MASQTCRNDYIVSSTIVVVRNPLFDGLVEIVHIIERKYGFKRGKLTIQLLRCLRMVQDKHGEFGRKLHMVFVGLE